LLRRANEGDLTYVLALLEAAGLPTEGVGEHFGSFVVAESGPKVVGAAGLELYGANVLLRSVVVAPETQGTGLGSRLTRRALEEARRHGARAVYLLTTTAEGFFPCFGFLRVGRDVVPFGVQDSLEFRGACPSSAVVMRVALEQAFTAESVQ